jgi:3-isopropylmalate/(R)-2-methylmalate dehydratase small subunit
MKGRLWKFGDNVDTDVIIPYKYKARSIDPNVLAEHCMEGLDPDFSKKVHKGDFIVGGRNFGCGSSREQAPVVIKACGISAVISESFARIFYRNSLNIGLYVFVCKGISKIVNQGNTLEIDTDGGAITNLNTGRSLKLDPTPVFLDKMVKAGGLIEYYKKFRKFPWDDKS